MAMVGTSAPPLLSELQNPQSVSEQLRSIKTLKAEVIGHDLQKAKWVEFGALDPLMTALSDHRAEGKQKSVQNAQAGGDSVALSEEDQVRLEAVNVIGSLTCGVSGAARILSQNASIPVLIALLSPAKTPTQVLAAVLRTLNLIVDGLLAFEAQDGAPVIALCRLLYTNECLSNFVQILSQKSHSALIQSQINHVADLISKTCREERHQIALTDLGILDLLGTLLARFVVATGYAIPTVEQSAVSSSGRRYPEAAPKSSSLCAILDAVTTIIQGSRYRSLKLLLSPSILDVLPLPQPDEAPEWLRHSRAQPSFHANRPIFGASFNTVEYCLPYIPIHKKTSAVAAAFPPLGPSNTVPDGGALPKSSKNSKSQSQPIPSNVSSDKSRLNVLNGEESPVIAWLLCMIRSEHGEVRLRAAALVTVLFKNGLAHRKRERSFAFLLVPLLVKMLHHDSRNAEERPKSTVEDRSATRKIQEEAPAVLAGLIADSGELQKAAAEGHAIKKLSHMLKIAYDPLPKSQIGSVWSPEPHSDEQSEERANETDPAIVEAIRHKYLVRESTLKALAALATFRDEYRRKIIENGVTKFILSSLTPLHKYDAPEADNQADLQEASSPPTGNPPSVLIAACGIIRALSRSVGMLRTCLIDAGVAMPLFTLLLHPEIEVKIAATAAVCNLILEFSPMREAILRAGVLNLLCRHAHSPDTRLRLNAVWALKHLVFSADKDFKISCVEELGKPWLIRLICDSEELKTLSSGSDAKEDGSMYVDGAGDQAPTSKAEQLVEDLKMSEPSIADSDTTSDGFKEEIVTSECDWLSKPLVERLEAAKDDERNPMRKARRDDAAVQEQALDFIRNLIAGPGSIDLLDYLFESFSEERLFEMLTMKLRSRQVVWKPGTEPETVQPEGEIVVAAAYVLVHIAAGLPRHRQILIAQTGLLKLLLPLVRNAKKEARVALAWMVIHLTWVDEQADHPACKARAAELRLLGFQAELEALEEDPELDVRERTKTALWQLKSMN